MEGRSPSVGEGREQEAGWGRVVAEPAASHQGRVDWGHSGLWCGAQYVDLHSRLAKASQKGTSATNPCYDGQGLA